MLPLFYLLLAIYILACVIMIVAILLHESKGGGLATAFGGGGSESAFGATIGRKINRFTAGAVVFFLVLSLVLGVLWAKVHKTPTSAAPGSAAGGSLTPGPTDAEAGAPDQPKDTSGGTADSPGETTTDKKP
ncbi:MAG: preprotein translocase subunit SecG [Planctomycetota bacterium]